MLCLMKIDGVRPDPSDSDLSDAGIVIEHFSLSLKSRNEVGGEKSRSISVQAGRRGDEASIDLLRLAISQTTIDEVVILCAYELDGALLSNPTRIILLDAIIEEFVTMGGGGDTLNENISISATGIIYEHGSRRFDERRIGR